MMRAAFLLVALALNTAGAARSPNAKPNIIFVLADDWNEHYGVDREDVMPNLHKYLGLGGAEFVNHVVTAPVCGPSRSSLLAGRYPHNTGYVANAAVASVDAWRKQENSTVGTFLTQAGYATAFFGKYVNGMENDVPSGWHHWGGLTGGNIHGAPVGGTYNYYNASQWSQDFDASGRVPVGPLGHHIWEGVHQAEFLANQTVAFARNAHSSGQPFFIHTTPVMVHWGSCVGPNPPGGFGATDPHFEMNLFNPTRDSQGKIKGKRKVPISACPTHKNAHLFAGQNNPHFPSWNMSATGDVPVWIQNLGNIDHNGCCDDWDAWRQDLGWQNRTASTVDLDDFLGTIFRGLEDMGALDNTYVIITGDNGYHLGPHHLLLGKTEPYDHDLRVPTFVRGPGIPGGSKVALPTNHMDITATIVDLAGASAYAGELDGKSFKAALSANPPAVAAWRNYSFSEFYVNENTWLSMRYVDPASGQPAWKLTVWCTNNQVEVFQLDRDEFELQNIAGYPAGKDIIQQWLPTLLALGQCKGESCRRVMPVHPLPAQLLPCHNPGPLLNLPETFYDP